MSRMRLLLFGTSLVAGLLSLPLLTLHENRHLRT